MTTKGDEEILDLLSTGEPIGQRVFVRSTARGSRVTTTEARMTLLHPPRQPRFRDSYENVLVHRDGRILEVTINRPEQRVR